MIVCQHLSKLLDRAFLIVTAASDGFVKSKSHLGFECVQEGYVENLEPSQHRPFCPPAADLKIVLAYCKHKFLTFQININTRNPPPCQLREKSTKVFVFVITPNCSQKISHLDHNTHLLFFNLQNLFTINKIFTFIFFKN